MIRGEDAIGERFEREHDDVELHHHTVEHDHDSVERRQDPIGRGELRIDHHRRHNSLADAGHPVSGPLG